MGLTSTTTTNPKIQGTYSIYVILHQIGFLLTGICTTLGVQWLFYRGAATSMSLLPQLSSYTGMLLVGFFIPILLKKKKKGGQYLAIQSPSTSPPMIVVSPASTRNTIEEEEIEQEDQSSIQSDEQTIVYYYAPLKKDGDELEEEEEKKEEGPIHHVSIIKLAALDIIASFALTIGFSIIGSGMYQVIYSSVVVWCAILTWLFTGRALTTIQWLAIIGTSVGLGISSLDSMRGGSPFQQDDDFAAAVAAAEGKIEEPATSSNMLFNGTLMTLCGTFISACIYVYADNILSKNNKKEQQPLPARVCYWMGVYTSFFTWIWIAVYTLPQWHDIIHIKKETSTAHVLMVYFLVTVANALHSWSYYELIERTGNVATGILQGLRAILVYAISHVWYCQEDSAQCFTTSKGFGSIIVISCVLLFTLGKK